MENIRSLPWVLTMVLLLTCQAGVAGPELPREELASDREVVVLLHGLGRNNMAMWLLARRLEDAGFHVERIGYSSLNVSPGEILEEVGSGVTNNTGSGVSVSTIGVSWLDRLQAASKQAMIVQRKINRRFFI